MKKLFFLPKSEVFQKGAFLSLHPYKMSLNYIISISYVVGMRREP